MATHEIVNHVANGIRRNLDEGIRLNALDVAETHEAAGKIRMGPGRFLVSLYVYHDSKWMFSVKIEGKANKAHRRRAAQRVLDALGIRYFRDGDGIRTNQVFNRKLIAQLAWAFNTTVTYDAPAVEAIAEAIAA